MGFQISQSISIVRKSSHLKKTTVIYQNIKMFKVVIGALILKKEILGSQVRFTNFKM